MQIEKFPFWNNKKFKVTDLFRNWEQGVWYDPSDISRYMSNLWPEMVVNGNFNDWLTGWINGSDAGWTVTVVDGVLNVTNVTGIARATQNIAFIPGKTYKISWTQTWSASFYYSTSWAIGTYSDGYQEVILKANDDFISFSARKFSAGTVTLDNVSIKEIVDIATNATMYQDSVWTIPVTWIEQPVGLIIDKSKNLLLWSDLVTNGNFATSTAGWSEIIGAGGSITWAEPGKVLIVRDSSNVTLFQLLTLTAWKTYRFTTSALRTSGSGNMFTVLRNGSAGADPSVLVLSHNSLMGKFQYYNYIPPTTGTYRLELSRWTNSGNGEAYSASVKEVLWTPAYQTTAIDRPILRQDLNWKYYLASNGSNTWMRTSDIDFSSTDEINVFASVRKIWLSEWQIAETSLTQVTNPWAIQLRAQFSWDTYLFGSRWSASAILAVTPTNYAPPISNVLTWISKISTDNVILRVNWIQASSSSADQWTWNFWNYPLFLFRRAWTTIPFNWYFYGLIIRWKLSTNSQISKAEKYLTQKTFSSITPALDGITSASALSLRKLYSNYTWPCLRVRNNVTNVETDIGFAEDGWINQTALLAASWVNSAFVVTWYDQSWNARNATQITAALQPRIVNAWVVEIQNGRPCVLTSVAQSGMSIVNTWLFRNIGWASISTVFRLQAWAMTNNVSLAYVSTGSGSTQTRFALMLTPSWALGDPTKIGMWIRRLDADWYYPLSWSVNTADLVGNTTISTIVMDYSTATANQWINRNHNIINAPAQTPWLTENTDPLLAIIFSRGTTAIPIGTSIQEVIFYNQALTTEQRTQIENSQSLAFNLA